jgi:hypothetical protein
MHKDLVILKNILEEYRLESYFDEIFKQSSIENYLIPTDILTGFTKIGGCPNLPKGLDYPYTGDFKMQFFMQIKLSELKNVPNYDEFLPNNGLLYFFTDERQDLSQYLKEYSKEDAREILAEFKKYTDKKIKYQPSRTFFTYYHPNENEELREVKAPSEFLNFPFYTCCGGWVEKDLIRPEIFLRAVSTVSYPRSLCVLNLANGKKVSKILDYMDSLSLRSPLKLLNDYFLDWSTDTDLDEILGERSLNPDLDGELAIGCLDENTKKGDFSQLKFIADFEIID